MDKFPEIGKVRLFLEPPDEAVQGAGNGAWIIITMGGQSGKLEIPADFIQRADEKLDLNNRLVDYFEHRPIPEEQRINRFGDTAGQLDFFSSLAQGPWDCCTTNAASKDMHNARYSLLIEYEVSPDQWFAGENVRRNIYRECEQLYVEGLRYYNASAGSSLPADDAANEALFWATHKLMRKYGIRAEVMIPLVAEELGKGSTLSKTDAQSQSIPMPPLSPEILYRIQPVWCNAGPTEPKITPQVVVRRRY